MFFCLGCTKPNKNEIKINNNFVKNKRIKKHKKVNLRYAKRAKKYKILNEDIKKNYF